jgi:two-component system sensor histidine kinase KdpD
VTEALIGPVSHELRRSPLSSTARTTSGWTPVTINAAIDRKQRLLAEHRLSVVIEDDVPLVHVDPALIGRTLEHLIENAAKSSPPNSPIEVRAERSGGTVRLAVKDRGAGLSREEQERIWERFYRSPRLRERIGGSGLGLWIAHALVAACDGFPAWQVRT